MHLPVVREEVKGQKAAANAELARSAPRTALSGNPALLQHHGQSWMKSHHYFSTKDSAQFQPSTGSAPRTAQCDSATIPSLSLMRTRVVLTSAIHATSGDSLQTCRVQLLQARSLCGCQLHENLFHYPAGCRRSTRLCLRNLNHGRWHHRTETNHRPTFDVTQNTGTQRSSECHLTFFIEVEVLEALVEVAGGVYSSDVGVGVDWSQARDGRAVPHWGLVALLWRKTQRGRVLNVASQGELEAWHTVI